MKKLLNLFILSLFLLLFVFQGSQAQSGEALNFGSSNDYVLVPGFNLTSINWTFETWFKVDNGSGNNRLMHQRDSGGSGPVIFGVLNNRLNINPNSGSSLVGTGVITNNVWHHVAYTFDGTTFRVYLDGVLDFTNTTSAPPGSSNGDFAMGVRKQLDNSVNWAGDIDNFRIWQVARTQVEIQANMNCEFAASETGLYASFQFNEGTATANNAGVTTLPDSSGNGNDGTLTNFTLSGTASNWVTSGAASQGCSLTRQVPTLSQWGLIILALLLMTFGTLQLIKRESEQTA